uniref:Segment polarity protein dishevelled DVL-2 n=1 Tax=Aceria tosichella TaxID=561515 RepID=A0A6G1S9N6_9ACAR
MTEYNYNLNRSTDMGVQSTSPMYQRVGSPQNETKLCIIIDSKEPLLMKVPVEPGRLTLEQFKNFVGLNDSHYKFYFKSHDSEFGMVKEELVDDDSILPVEDGKIVVWVISNDSVQYSLFDPNDKQESGEQLKPDDIDGYQSNYGYSRQQVSYSPIGRNRGLSAYDCVGTSRTNRVVANLYLDSHSTLGLTVLCPGDELNYTGGIFIDKIQPNSVAWRDGCIKSGDRIVEINGFDLRSLKVGEAINIFREFINRKGAINIVLDRADDEASRVFDHKKAHEFTGMSKTLQSKSSGFDPATELPAPVIDSEPLPTPKIKRALPKINNFRGTHSLPRSITPRSWYTTSNIDNLTSSSELHHPLDSRSVYEPTTPNSLRKISIALHCGKDNIYTIYEALKNDAASLDIRDRDWLKVVVKDAFLGSTLIKWLSRNVYGFCNRSEVKRFANQMLSLELIKSPVSNSSFSEKCYYTLT